MFVPEAILIALREGLDALLITGILLGLVTRLGRPDARKHVCRVRWRHPHIHRGGVAHPPLPDPSLTRTFHLGMEETHNPAGTEFIGA